MKLGPQFDQAAADWFYHQDSSPSLQKAVDTHSKSAPILYRGTAYPGQSRDAIRQLITAPEGFSMPVSEASKKHGSGFSSWSSDRDVAETFSSDRSRDEGDRVLFVVSGFKGFDMYKHADTDDVGEDIHLEREWLVPSSETENVRFRHTIRPNKDLQIFVGNKVE